MSCCTSSTMSVTSAPANRCKVSDFCTLRSSGTFKRICRADASELHCSVGMQKLVSGCSSLAQRPEFRKIFNLSGLDVIATRIW